VSALASQPSVNTPSTTTATAVHSRDVVIAGLFVSCAPLVLLVFNRNWFFIPDANVDAWHYVGFFREYLNPDYSPGAYKLGRLPWILTGFLFHRLFSPIWAAYLLHGLFLCATTLALFAGLYMLLGRLGLAAVVATLFGFYTQVHGSGGWDYHNTAAGAFYFLSMALLAWPVVVSGHRLPLMLTGSVIALAVHSNIMLVNFVPVFAFVYITIVRSRSGEWPRVRTVVARAAWALLGAIVVTTLLGLINRAVGREFLFFRPLVDMVLNMLADPAQYQAPNVKPWSSGWAWTGGYLSLTAAVVAVGAITLMVRRRGAATPVEHVARSLVLSFVVMALWFVVWQVAGQTALDWDVVAYPLTVASILALAGLFVGNWPEACERHWRAAMISTAIVSAICLSGTLDFFMVPVKATVAPFISIVGAVLFAAGLVIYLSRPVVATMAAFVVVFGLANSLLALPPERYSANDPCKIRPDVYEAIIDAASWLGTLDPTHTRTRIWFDGTEQIQVRNGCTVAMNRMARSITAMAFVPYVTPPTPMPGVGAVPQEALRQIAADERTLVVISSRSEPLEQWNRRFEGMGLSNEEVSRHSVRLAGSSFALHAWRFTSRPPPDLTFDAPIIAITRDTPRQMNVYGTPKGQVSVDGDRVVFHPTDVRDHIAYPFVPLSSRGDESWARVRVEAPDTASPSCQLIVQDAGFTTLATLGCSSATRYVRVAPTVRGIRIYLIDEEKRPFALPQRIEVALSTPLQ